MGAEKKVPFPKTDFNDLREKPKPALDRGGVDLKVERARVKTAQKKTNSRGFK